MKFNNLKKKTLIRISKLDLVTQTHIFNTNMIDFNFLFNLIVVFYAVMYFHT